MFGVCFKYNPGYQSLLRDQYYELVKAYPDIKVYERGVPSQESPFYNDIEINKVDNADDLPDNIAIVVVSGKDAKYIKGNINLIDYVHPKNAVYFFGDDQSHLHQNQIGQIEEYDKIYIPIEENVWSPQAMAMVLYDRQVKNG